MKKQNMKILAIVTCMILLSTTFSAVANTVSLSLHGNAKQVPLQKTDSSVNVAEAIKEPTLKYEKGMETDHGQQENTMLTHETISQKYASDIRFIKDQTPLAIPGGINDLTPEKTSGKHGDDLSSPSTQSINELNDELTKKGALWRAAENKFTKMSPEEMRGYLGLIFDPNETNKQQDESKTFHEKAECLPDYFDWRSQHSQNYMTPIRDQGGCGSCWAFATIGALEGHINAYYNNPTIDMDLSEEDLVSCSGAGSCGGGYPDGALNYIMQYGVCTESCFPYTASDESCSQKCENWQEDAWKITSWIDVPLETDAIKNALITKGPLITGMAVYSDFPSYSGGIYSHISGDLLGYHAIVIVGYGNYDGIEYWICKNSWGEAWGEDGFFNICMGDDSGIDSMFVYAIDAPVPPYPLEVQCTDNDNDGYCTWGIGPKPDSCPCGNEIPDCNDSDPSIHEGCGMSETSYGILHVTSTPTNANVYVKDLVTGEYFNRGKTPLTTMLTSGERDLIITLDHYENNYTTVLINEGQEADVHVNLLEMAQLFYPQNYDIIRPGNIVEIIGTVPDRSDFVNYQVEHSVGNNNNGSNQTSNDDSYGYSTEGITLINDGMNPVINDTIATWNTSNITNGDFFTIRLTVNYVEHQETEYIVNLYLDPTLKMGWPKRINFDYQGTSHQGHPAYYWGGYLEPVVGDINHDGHKEIIFFKDGDPRLLYVFRDNGSLLWSSQIGDTHGGWCVFIPLVGDINCDGFDEIIVYDFSGFTGGTCKLLAFDYHGSLLWSTVMPFDQNPTFIMADVNNDGYQEIIVKGNTGDYYGAYGPQLVIVNDQGNIITQWSKTPITDWYTLPASMPAVGNFDDDPELEIVCTTQSRRIIDVYNLDGSEVPGWPISTTACVISSPAVGDINNDGSPEIVVTTSAGGDGGTSGVYAYDKYGTLLWSFGEGVNFWTSSPALADLNGDQNLEIIIGDCMAWSSRNYVLYDNGALASGWPQHIFWNALYSAVIGDVNGDGAADIIQTAGSGVLGGGGGVFAWNFNGTPIAGFPKVTEGDAQGPAVISDIDGDGKVELIASSDADYDYLKMQSKNRGSIYVWDLDGTFHQESMEWPTFHHDNQHTGLYGYEYTIPSNLPINPIPNDRATGVPITTDLSWTIGDPNSENIMYDVYFGTTNPPLKVSSNQTDLTFDPGVLNYNTRYYWRIISWNDSGTSAVGRIWMFTTEESLVAYTNGPYAGVVGQSIEFHGYASGGVPPYVSWHWDFGDGNISDGWYIERSYGHAGEYIVTLTVTDSRGNTASNTTTATITEPEPFIAYTNGPYTGITGRQIYFYGWATGGIPPYISWHWDFGDGNISDGWYIERSYGHAGEYIVTLTVTDYAGNTATNTTTAVITEPAPLVAYTNGPYAGVVGESIRFHGDASGGVYPYTYQWDFGDGTTSNHQKASHAYNSTGNYTVMLTVTDSHSIVASNMTTAFVWQNRPSSVFIDDDYNETTPGWGYDHFPKIQPGIDMVAENGTVFVASGIYHEHLMLEKSINLIGEDQQHTIIEGDACDAIVWISADHVNLSGFTIQPQEIGSSCGGVLVTSSFNTIANMIIHHDQLGIYVASISEDFATDNLISKNIIDLSTSHSESIGIYFECTFNNTLIQNSISNSMLCGVALIGSSKNLIVNNMVANHPYGIILLYGSNNNTVTGNTITDNDLGFMTDFSKKSLLPSLFHKDGKDGGSLASTNNMIYLNNFITNMQQVYDPYNNGWYNVTLHQGNYWDTFDEPGEGAYDDFQGMNQDQLGSDGIVDLGLPSGGLNPYTITGGSNQDVYPLIHRFVLGDMNIDGVVDFGDINPFVMALSNPALYQTTYKILPALHGDINQDGILDFGDINPFVEILTS